MSTAVAQAITLGERDVLERSTSRPSLTHSSSSTTEDSQDSQLQLNQVPSSNADSETLVTPIDPPLLQVSIKNGSSPIKIEATIDEEIEHNSPVKQAKKGRLNLSKSMQTLRKKSEKGRERASSVGEKTAPPVPALPPMTEKKTISQTKNSTPNITRPPMPTKQSSGFSSFLRRLTGRSNTSPAPSKGSAEQGIKDEKAATIAKRKTMAPTGNSKPSLPRISTAQAEKGPSSAVSQASRTQANKPFVQSPLPVNPVTPAVKETDPLLIPLPASPILEEPPTLPPGASPAVDFSAPSAPQSNTTQSTSLSKKKAEGMLSLEGFDFEEEQEEGSNSVPVLVPPINATTASTKKEESESNDVVKPLAPIRIPSRTNTAGPASASSVRSSIFSSSAETKIATPVSATSIAAPPIRAASTSPQHQNQGLSPEKIYEGIKLAGSSPPRKAPVGSGMGDLGRKESKWRKSVMGLSDKAKPVAKRQSAMPPPTSHDAYQAQQARIAKNRQSCAPTLHSSASIAAAARGQMNHMKLSKDEQDMAETFFMS
ncbi:uncharacterized protein I303_100572 [Kwoniella dejecticola CBS 10117]|uniref:Uncharacterized protein n=1 Tax=Kwoniella dejecticola CBS 10117 TaxID=1296121 RepID=A0A1A6AFA5_9TREE|nr:uncharacterized protein I303_00574 [Kwoniella dejecticola CBS 10117]OBR88757.1 hypothetical protein I303_00574 [Kwoniella dejecticola CBS 10117]